MTDVHLGDLARGVAVAAAMCAVGMTLADAARAEALPRPLVYLADVAPTIRQDMRYAGPNNFTGARVPGYEAPECILTRGAAEALRRVQQDLAAKSLSLKVYDCYRPERAVRSFMAWAGGRGKVSDPAYFPNVDRRSLVAQGYIAARSGHSTGTAIDLTIVPLDAPAAGTSAAGGPATGAGASSGEASAVEPGATMGSCISAASQRAADDSLDMGTGYDCFDRKSHTFTGGLSEAQRSNRATLVTAMSRHGFRNYAKEWWHFSYGSGGGSFDVPVRPRKAKPAAAEIKSETRLEPATTPNPASASNPEQNSKPETASPPAAPESK